MNWAGAKTTGPAAANPPASPSSFSSSSSSSSSAGSPPPAAVKSEPPPAATPPAKALPAQKAKPETAGDEGQKKRRKALRACTHCQKAHLTCDNGRPCQQCIKRAMHATCADGERKKAKYLRADEQEHAADMQTQPAQHTGPFLMNYIPAYAGAGSGASVGFGSNAAQMEYSMMTSMLGNMSDVSTDTSSVLINTTSPTGAQPLPAFPAADGNVSAQSPAFRASEHLLSSGQVPVQGYSSSADLPARQTFKPPTEAHEIYTKVMQPFKYTEVYTGLNNYLRRRFNRSDLIRIARTISSYRPSFIACTKTLNEEDLIFAEKAFQRALFECEKFINVSGTPTAIWRRACQLETVGREFTLLTGYSRNQLLDKLTFIVELFDDQSTIQYFEHFAAHAFADTSHVTSTCTLINKAGNPIPCSVCFTFKRDIFDIPMMIIGQFLPIFK